MGHHTGKTAITLDRSTPFSTNAIATSSVFIAPSVNALPPWRKSWATSAKKTPWLL